MQRIVGPEPQGWIGQDDHRDQPRELSRITPAKPVLMDLDPQGFILSLGVRKAPEPSGTGAGGGGLRWNDGRTTRSFQLRVPASATHVIVDTPAALEAPELPDITRGADKILVPGACPRISTSMPARAGIRDLLLVAKVRREG